MLRYFISAGGGFGRSATPVVEEGKPMVTSWHSNGQRMPKVVVWSTQTGNLFYLGSAIYWQF